VGSKWPSEPSATSWRAWSEVTLEIANEGEPPEVAFTAPADLAEVTESTEIRGTVESQLLESWSLAYRFAGETEWSELATGNIPVADGPLATFDPTLLLNGLYELRLRAVDFAGVAVEETMAVVVEGQMKIGHFTLSFIDLAIPLSGLDVEIVRTYDSRQRQMEGDFGHGWTLDVRQGSYRNNRPPGDGWQLSESFLPCDTVQETKSHLTTIRLSDQEVYRFALRLVDGAPTTGGCFARAEFEYVDGPLSGTTLEILGSDEVFYANGSDVAVTPDSQEPFVPEGVKLTTRDGRIFELDLAEGVTRVEDLNGNRIDITPAGVTHSSGVGIDFERDGEGRIVKITDPEGRALIYEHDDQGDLVTVTDRDGSATRFTYHDDHLLDEILDPLGARAIKSEFDEDGRLLRTIDADGRAVELEHDLASRREIIRNRLGFVRIFEYDERGNVIRETDELGNVTLRTFDAQSLLSTETDPLGNTTTGVYDTRGDLVSVTDPASNTTEFAYDHLGKPLTITDPRGHVTTHRYDSAGNLTEIIDALGNTTSFAFDTEGNLTSETDAAGNVTSFHYDARGNLVQRTDPAGNVTTFSHDDHGNVTVESRTRTLSDGTTETLTTSHTYDALGRRLTTTRTDGSTIGQSYDALGRVVSRTDALGRTTHLDYDAFGRLTNTRFADGTTEERSYDAEGRMVARQDRAGRVTTITYDAAGRLSTTTFPDGTTTTHTYDAAGQLITKTDQRGHTTVFTYDAAGRRTRITDALGHTTTVTYDPAGNQTAVTDPAGNETLFAYDALGRRIETTFADGTTIETGYDELNRRISETDQAGGTTRLGYDPLGRLIEVTDAMDQTVSYSYDDGGNRLTQTDANGNTTRFTYDEMGRKTSRTLPGGASESFTYNADGTLASHTDFSGATTTFEYDDNQRLTRRALPDGSQVALTYSPTGRRTSVTDARGVTTYAYDELDRRTVARYPDGSRLEYAYDAAGNRTRLTATIGSTVVTTTSTYDAVDRLSTVTDPGGGVYEHSYDPAGNRSKLTFPNGVETTASYDALHRLVDLTTTSPSDGEVLQSYAFTLNAVGQRTRIDEADGRSRVYDYDPARRLIRDQLLDADGAMIYRHDFTYDAVGNRLTRVEDDGGGTPSTVTSTYDSRDRLLTETPGPVYVWDADGNLTNETDGGNTTYSWDPRNRLVGIAHPDGTTVATVYDAEGNRVRTEVTAPDGTTTAKNYLVDTSGGLSQVVAEYDDTGQVGAFYVRGDQLLALGRPGSGATRYFHADGVGSIRLLTDETRTVTDRYAYTAFGVELEHTGSDPQPYRFAGEPFDPNSGFYYNRARWMDPSAGRFVSMDPFEGFLTEPATLHRYVYAMNRPVGVVDPSGLFGQINLGTTLAVLTTASILTNLAITGVVGTRAALADDFALDAWFFTAGIVGQGRGLFGGSELDFLLLNNGQFWVSPAFSIGFGPVAAFRSRATKGARLFAFGVIGNLKHPAGLEGAGSLAIWPVGLIKLLRKAPFKRGKSWSLAMHLAKRAKNFRGTSILVGQSSTGPILLGFGPQYSALGTTVTYNLPFQPLSEVFDRYGELFEEFGVSETLTGLRALGSSASELGERYGDLEELTRVLF